MKTIFNHLATFAMTLAVEIEAPLASAQQDLPDVGFVRIVPVLTVGTGKTHILIDGQDIYPSGYDVGQKTGGISLKEGAHSIALQKTGIRPTITSFNVGRGNTLTLIGYAEKEPQKNPSNPPQWKSRLIPFKRIDSGNDYHLTLISLCPQDEIKILKDLKAPAILLKRLVTTDIALGRTKSEISIKANGERVAVISLEDLGNYTVVIYEDQARKLQGLWFYDPAFSPGG